MLKVTPGRSMSRKQTPPKCWAARLSGAEALDDARSIIDTRNASWNDGFDQYGWPEN